METSDIKNWLASAQEEALATAAGRQMRAWNQLQGKLFGPTSTTAADSESAPSWTSGFLTFGAVAAIAIAVGITLWMNPGGTNGYAQSRQPDLYTSTFYSTQAEADVVWITGLGSADDTENMP